MTARRWFLIAFAAALLTGAGCSNDGPSSTGATGPALSCADSGNAGANGVTTNCAGGSGDVQVDVVMGGPAAGSTTLRGLNFDVVYDPTNLAFVPAGNYASPLFPAALIAVTESPAGRVIVSIQQPGGSPAVSVGTGQHGVLSLTFTRQGTATFPPAAVTFQNSEATSASAAITFSSGLSIAYQ